MNEINFCNSAGRDAMVAANSVTAPRRVRWLDEQGRQACHVRVLKSPLEHELEALIDRWGDLGKVGAAMLEGDPEIEMEMTGALLRETSRVYINADRQVVHKVTPWEIVRLPSGEIRDRRVKKLAAPNMAVETPLKWTGKFVSKADAVRKFVFVNKQQLVHTNGLTYDFLFGMAEELQRKQSLMLLGGGPKGNQPLVLRRGGSPYRGFLEGRTNGDKYCLLLHFSNLELKAPQNS